MRDYVIHRVGGLEVLHVALHNSRAVIHRVGGLEVIAYQESQVVLVIHRMVS